MSPARMVYYLLKLSAALVAGAGAAIVETPSHEPPFIIDENQSAMRPGGIEERRVRAG